MTFFITDIHGDDVGLERLLEHAQVDFNRDLLIIGGDMIDRGNGNAKVIRRIKELTEAFPDHVIALLGNHEEMALAYFWNGDKLWLQHGGRETLRDWEKTFSKDQINEFLQWMNNLPLVYQTESYMFTHAGLNPDVALLQQGRDILWMSESEFYGISREELLALTGHRPVVHGHTPVERIYFDGVRLNCDLGSNTYPVIEARGLCLVELEQMIYHVYLPSKGRIETRSIGRF